MRRFRANSGGVVALRLSDRLQDYGIVAIAVTEMEGDALMVRNWVMSCRVFGRRLEHVMRGVLSDLAEAHNARRIGLHYAASAKNGLVPAALQSVGFQSESPGYFETDVRVPDTIAQHYMDVQDRREAAFAEEEIH